jgi:glycosyltransferase involved in cell wall biosynthesis
VTRAPQSYAIDGKTHSSAPNADRFVFVLEQSLGHAAHALNLERVLGTLPVDASIIRLGPAAKKTRPIHAVTRNWSVEASWTARKAVSRRLRQPADGLFIHTQVASLMCQRLMRTVPTIISMDATPMNFDELGSGYAHNRQPSAVEWAKRKVNRSAFDAAAAIVTWSRWAATSLQDDYGIPSGKVHVIHPGVDLNRFKPAASRDHGSVRILFVGGDFVRKGGYDLLDAMTKLNGDVELDIVTSSPIRDIPAGPTVRIHTGLAPGSPELIALYQRADVFALPSTAECYGIVLSEALACGLPIVACRVGGVEDIVVHGESGLLVPPHDVGALTTALQRLINVPGLRHQMGEAGVRMAMREHDADRNCNAIVDLMRNLSCGS